MSEGKDANTISKEMGISLAAVKRNIKYIEKLGVSDLTSEEVAEKRSELYLELAEAGDLSKELFEEEINKENKKSIEARRYYDMWMQAIQLKMKLYGLDSVKVDNMFQFNTQVNNQTVPDKVSMEVGEKIAKALKDGHEKKLETRYVTENA